MNITILNRCQRVVRPRTALLQSVREKKKFTPVCREAWFTPCCKSPCCPKHNPIFDPEDVEEEPCEPPRNCWEPPPKCIFERYYCTRRHGGNCSCDACVRCEVADDGYRCNRRKMHGADCKCSLCHQPHDLGCRCSECRTLTNSADILRRIKRERCERDTCEARAHTRYQRILMMGEKCYCLVCHEAGCKCDECRRCADRLRQMEKNDALEARREEQLVKVLEGMEESHGANCDCLKCAAMRQKVDMTLCHEHLERCVCKQMLGKACKCDKCRMCLLKKQTVQIPNAEDYW